MEVCQEEEKDEVWDRREARDPFWETQNLRLWMSIPQAPETSLELSLTGDTKLEIWLLLS